MAPVIPFVDLKTQHLALADDIQRAIGEVMAQAAFVQGPAVAAFEAAFARYCGVAGVAGTGSGTAALELAIQALGVGPGDEVIVPTQTFVATAAAVARHGAVPCFADCDPLTYQLDPADVAARITDRTVGIVAVHLYGHPAPMAALQAIADAHGLWIIEDAAQAHGARYRGQRVGGLGTLSCFSFYPGKNLGACGDGGCVAGNDLARLDRVRRLANHGRLDRYRHGEVGGCHRLDTIQAAVLGVKLAHLEAWNAQRRQIAEWYAGALAGTPLALPVTADDVEPVFHLYVVRAADRDALAASLQAEGIETGIHYPIPLHLQPCFAQLGHRVGDYPVSERISAECLSLPMFPGLRQDQVRAVGAAIRRHYASPVFPPPAGPTGV